MMILKGFRFGMLLQLAVGPVCMYVFHTASNRGFIDAFFVVLAVSIIDAFYILLAILGITSFIKDDRLQKAFRIIGALIVACFGLSIILGVFGISIMPRFISFKYTINPFINGLLLTASNPLTILFWSGVFSSEICDNKMEKINTYLFGIGAVISTLFFLSLVALVGMLANYTIPENIVNVLNLLVGAILIYFSLRIFMSKTSV